MHVAVRSYLTAGIAAVGTAAIIVAPIQPTLPELHVRPTAVMSVDLAATVNPIEAWAQVVQTAISNTGELVNQLVATPAPIAGQIITNQLASFTLLGDTAQATIEGLGNALQGLPAAFDEARQLLDAGQIVEAFNSLVAYTFTNALGLLGAIGAVTAVLQNPVQNLANAIGSLPDLVAGLGIGVLAPGLSALTAGVQTIQEVSDAFGAGDPAAALGAIINAPAALTGAFLNGNPASVFPAGMLSPWTGSAFDSGPIGIALFLRDELAATLFPVGHQQAAKQQAATESLAVPRVATVASAPHAAGPKLKKAGGSGRPAADNAGAGDGSKNTTGGPTKAGQKRTGKAGSSRHAKATAGA
jgi:hypothetical protein